MSEKEPTNGRAHSDRPLRSMLGSRRQDLCALFIVALAAAFALVGLPYSSMSTNGHRCVAGCREEKAPVDPCRHVAVDAQRGLPRATTDAELVLVTGGSGFIGSHLVTQLLDLGYTVRVFDSLETGNLLYLDLRHPRLEFQYGDILDIDALHRAMVGVRGVFHFAAASKVLPSLKSPKMATFNIERNALGTSNVLEAANVTKLVTKVVYAASSTYYGNQPVPFAEDDPFRPTSPYAASKYMGELQMLTNDGLYDLPSLSLRFFMVYGPRNPAEGAYAIVTGKFLRRLLDGQPLLIEGSGEQFRDFIHVQDVARACILAYQSDVRGTSINVGSGVTYSVKDVADIVSPRQEHRPARRNDLEGTLANTCRAKELLHFDASYDFTDVMQAMKADMLAGKREYLDPMWLDDRVVEAFDSRLPGWASLGSSNRSFGIKAALDKDPLFLDEVVTALKLR